MATTVADNLKMHRFSVDDYYRMQQAGILDEDDHVELIDGRIVEVPPVGPTHAGMVKLLHRHFGALEPEVIIAVQDPLHLDRHNEPEPDLMLLRPRDDFYRERHPTASDAFLLIEVADTTLKKDLEVKAPLYAMHGVTEYWVVDLEGFRVVVHREPRGGMFKDVRDAAGATSVSPQAFAGHTLDLSKLFL